MMKTSADGPHDVTANASIDQAEHLRTIHFTILVACVGLWIATALDKSREVERAHEDISGILRLRQVVNETWLQEYVAAAVAGRAELPSHPPYVLHTTLVHDNKKFRLRLVPTRGDWTVITPELASALSLPATRRVLGFTDNGHELVLRNPESLIEFRALWDVLALIDRAFVLYTPMGDITAKIQSSTEPAAAAAVPSRLSAAQMKTLSWSEYGEGGETIRLRLLLNPAASEPLCVLTGSQIFNGDDGRFLYVEVSVGATCLPVALAPQVELREIADRPWITGTFASTFRDLDSTSELYQDLALSKVEAVLSSERKRTGHQFEFAGTKVPAEAVTQLGFIILLTLQLYFVLHLRNFSNRISRDDSAIQVAWIVLYPDRGSKLAVIASCLTPPVVTGLLARELWIAEAPIAQIVAGAIAVILSSLLSAGAIRRINQIRQNL